MMRALSVLLMVGFVAACGPSEPAQPDVIQTLAAPLEVAPTTTGAATTTTTVAPTTTTEPLNPCHVWSTYLDGVFSGASIENQVATNRLWLDSIIPSRVRDDALDELDAAIEVFEAAGWDLRADPYEYVDLLMAMLGGSLTNLNEWFMADHYLGCTELSISETQLGEGIAACAVAVEPMLDAAQDPGLWRQMVVDEAGGFIEMIRPMAETGAAPGCYIAWAYFERLDEDGQAAYEGALPTGVRDYYSEFWG